MHSYTLNNADWSCTVCPSFGSNVISLRHKDFPILREPANMAELQSSPVLHGLPLLFPPNRTAGGRFTFDGVEYTLPVNETAHNNHLHGSLHSAQFQVVDHSDHRLITRFDNQSSHFPFPFTLELTDELLPTGFFRTVTVTNTGAGAMPLVMAFHTTFTAPERFSVPLGRRWVINEHLIPTGEKVPLTPEQAVFLDNCLIHGQTVGGFYEMAAPDARIGDFLFSTQGFDQWVLYNGGGRQDYLCVEPQLGPVNALNSGGYHRLESGEEYRFSLSITHL